VAQRMRIDPSTRSASQRVRFLDGDSPRHLFRIGSMTYFGRTNLGKEIEGRGCAVEVNHRRVHGPTERLHPQQGRVLTAFRNALWQLLHALELEDGVTDTSCVVGTRHECTFAGAFRPGQWMVVTTDATVRRRRAPSNRCISCLCPHHAERCLSRLFQVRGMKELPQRIPGKR